MAAAVADFRPVQAATHKIKKNSVLSSLELEPTSDILSAVAEQRSQARSVPMSSWDLLLKLKTCLPMPSKIAKSNALTSSLRMMSAIRAPVLESIPTRSSCIQSDGQIVPLPLLSKEEVAERVIDEVIFLLNKSIPRFTRG